MITTIISCRNNVLIYQERKHFGSKHLQRKQPLSDAELAEHLWHPSKTFEIHFLKLHQTKQREQIKSFSLVSLLKLPILSCVPSVTCCMFLPHNTNVSATTSDQVDSDTRGRWRWREAGGGAAVMESVSPQQSTPQVHYRLERDRWARERERLYVYTICFSSGL